MLGACKEAAEIVTGTLAALVRRASAPRAAWTSGHGAAVAGDTGMNRGR